MGGEGWIGLMSGTSLDGVDGVLVDFAGDTIQVQQHATLAFPESQRAEFLALNTGTTDELLRPMFEARGLRAGHDFFLVFSPERIDPGRKDFVVETTPKRPETVVPARGGSSILATSSSRLAAAAGPSGAHGARHEAA
jgi:hypothetical protein